MSFSGRYLPAVLLTCLSLTVSVFAQSTTKQPIKAPGGTVSGRVTFKDKGAAGVTVGIRKSEDYTRFDPFLRATTDQDGFYRITNVAAGAYEAFPSAPGFVNTDDMWAKSVIVGEGENVENINFALVRGGVITGRVTDADGKPLIEQPLNLYMVGPNEPQERPTRMNPSSTTQTDDRGIYRLFGLRPGRYKIAAGRGDDGSPGNFTNTRATYRQVFHPDATDPTKATIIEVREGSEANNVDITLGRPLQTFSVSGRVIDAEKGLPVPNTRFGFQRTAGDTIEFVNAPAASNVSGEFVVEGLIPGKYSVFLYPNQNLDMRAETLNFDIVDEDVSNLTIRLTKGASLTGVVVIESEDKTAPEKFSQLQLRAWVMGQNGGGIGSSAMSPIAPDGSFRMAGLPAGTVNMQLGARVGPFPPKGFNISRIERDGAALSPRGLEIKDGEQVTGLRVVLSKGNGTIHGVVKVENGSLPEGAQIYVRLTRTGEHAAGIRPPPVDARGQFLVEGLPPGTYEVMVSILNNGSPQRLNPVRREVNVQDGVVTDVVITFDGSATPQD
jgi:protocatechuate 3,4-dioxygenase beta subunit